MKDVKIGIALLALMGVAVLLTLTVSKWVIVGAGLTALILWLWVRLETGVWLDQFSDLRFSISGRRSSQLQPRRDQD